jgi:hypothetical protein
MIAAALVALAAFVGSQLLSPEAAGAQAPSGQINGCYKAKGGKKKKAKKKKGILRIVPSGKCKKKEKAISWNVQGPQGPRGARGPSGSADGDALARITLLEEGLAEALAQIELLQGDVDLLCSADGVGGLVGLINAIVGLPILGDALDPIGEVVCPSDAP